ncbi:MAG: indolepyruvate ferredoxin oxidoreductase family protein [Acidobacteria bacterium]|nr:indolepyruvate ferredoxin oxidoreductase family protein [Acidobacteriota bacterium]
MTSTEPYALTDRFLAREGSVFLTGIQALARLPLDQLRADRAAGLSTAALVAGYPGSPLGGFDTAVASAAKLAADLPVVCRPGLNEELAASAVMGSQLAVLQPDCRYDGIVGIWYGKAPGVDRAADALRHAVFAGTSMQGGAIALVGDDPMAKSSTIPSSSAGLLSDMHMPILYPGDPGEALDLGRHAVTLSRTTGLWVALKIATDVADGTANVSLDPHRIAPVIPDVDGELYRHRPDGALLTPHTVDLEREIVEVRYDLATRYASMNKLNYITVSTGDDWLGVVASGITYNELREAFDRLGFGNDEALQSAGIRLLKMSMPYPFDPDTIRRFAAGLEEIIVVEEKRQTIESVLKDALYHLSDRPTVVGKFDERGDRLVPEYGMLDGDTITPILRGRLASRLGDRLAPQVIPHEVIALRVNRTPFYCSGCPHNRSTAVPSGTLVGAGIGCHTMTLLMDPGRVGDIVGVTCMGSEGAQWVGMSEFVDRDHLVQNVGDGTYFHSAQLAVQFAVAAGVNITYKLLYNGSIAMTGGQLPQGQLAVEKVATILLAQGVSRVLVTTEDTARYKSVELPDGVEVWNRSRLAEAHATLASVAGVTVLIHDQACAAETRRARKRGLVKTPTRRIAINHRVCEGCGDCGEVSNCLSVQSIETPFGTKTTIDQSTCNYDYSCVEGDCPAFVEVEVDADVQTPSGLSSVVKPSPPLVQEPIVAVSSDEFAMRICGIGGTGVVTVGQIIGTAAMLDGYQVRGLDQTGLSQKAGPVVSDVRLTRDAQTSTNRLGTRQADLLLVFDQLVAASPRGLLTADPIRTAVVGSTSETPTGEMIGHHDIVGPGEAVLRERIALVTRSDAQHWADAVLITTSLFGNSAGANLFSVGMAVQAGFLPVAPSRIEEAIKLNGVAAEANIAAFRWGRAQISSPASVAAAVIGEAADETVGVSLPGSIERRIVSIADDSAAETFRRFASELIGWGNKSTANEWLDTVQRVAAAETGVLDGSTLLTEAVGANLFKLMAYKDEYEVARLMTDTDGMRSVSQLTNGKNNYVWKLHPPMLRALGVNKKMSISARSAPAIRALAKGKRLRGTWADPFSRTEVRRTEQALPGEYVTAIEFVLGALTPQNLGDAVALASLPDMVRGYEDLKMRRVATYRTALAEALEAFC